MYSLSVLIPSLFYSPAHFRWTYPFSHILHLMLLSSLNFVSYVQPCAITIKFFIFCHLRLCIDIFPSLWFFCTLLLSFFATFHPWSFLIALTTYPLLSLNFLPSAFSNLHHILLLPASPTSSLVSSSNHLILPSNCHAWNPITDTYLLPFYISVQWLLYTSISYF